MDELCIYLSNVLHQLDKDAFNKKSMLLTSGYDGCDKGNHDSKFGSCMVGPESGIFYNYATPNTQKAWGVNPYLYNLIRT